MKHRTLPRLCLMLVALVAFLTLMHTGYVRAASQNRYTYKIKEGTAYIVKAPPLLTGDVTVPAALDGYPVHTIGEYAFANNTAITGVTIPKDINSIVYCGFLSCLNLKTVTLPDTLKSIGTDAFADCESIDYNTRNNGHYLGNSENPYLAFMKPASDDVTTVTIGKETTVIYDSAFLKSSNLKAICVDGENPAYSDASGVLLTKDRTSLLQMPLGYSGYFTVPDTVTKLRDSAFSGCASLTGIVFQGDAPTIFDEDNWEAPILIPDIPVTVYYPADNATWTQAVKTRFANRATWISARPYQILEGADAVAGKDVAAISIGTNGNSADFAGVMVGDIPVSADSCTVSTGDNMTVTLPRAVLDTLPAGTHSLYVLFADGLAQTTLTITGDLAGDLDGIPGVDTDDAIYLLQHVLMPELFPVSKAVDFDGNGSLSVDDAIYLLQHVLMPGLFPLH